MIKTFREWLREFSGPVPDDMSNANIAFGVKGVNSKYRTREAPDGPSSFNPDELFLGDEGEEDEEDEDEEEDEENFVPDSNQKKTSMP